MDVVDILISIVVVTILVTIILAVVTYVAYKLRLSREPARRDDDPTALRYFVRYDPPTYLSEAAGGAVGAGAEGGDGAGDAGEEGDESSALERLERDVAGLGGHASQT